MNEFKPRILGIAAFTPDMVETLQIYFDIYAVDGVVSIEVTTHGLWLRHPITATRQFLGRADTPDEPISYSPQMADHPCA